MSNLSNFIINDGILTKYVGTDPHVIVPEGVTQIGAEAFAVELGETSSLETVVLPSTLRVIEKYAFHSADTLKRILFPCGLKEIADGAFFKCCSLESIEIPDSVAFIGRSAFCSCRRLEEVKWYTPFAGKRFHNLGVANPAEGSTVSADAFAGCASLTEIVLPEGIKVIGENAFDECVSLSKVTLPDSLETICDGAFAKCNSLKNITLPQNVSYVGKTAFPGLSGWGATAAVFSNIYVDPSNSAYCTNQGILYTKDRKTVVSCPAAYPAEELVIESDVTQISVSAFQGCHTIKKLVLPDTITTIGANAFSDMADLEEVILPKNLEVLPESAFSNCKKLKRITWPKKLHTIRKRCFEYCGIEDLHIPETVQQIDSYAFMNIKAETVRIPASVTQLGYCVFPMVRKIEVYDTIDPQAKPAASFCDSMNGSPNGHLGLIGFSMGEGYVKYACNGSLWDHTITVLSAADHSVKYKVRMPSEQQRSVYCTYASSWGRNAEFNFKAIEDIFQNLTADAKQDFVLDGLRYGVLSQSFQESLGGYVKKNALALCRSAIQEDNLQLLQTLEEYDVIKNLIAEQLLALAERHNSISCKAWLLKNARVPAKNGNASGKEQPVSELKKIWSYKKESEDGLTITSYRGIDVDVIVPGKIGKQPVIAIADDCFSINKDAETQRFLRTELRSVVIPDTVKVIGKRAFAHCEGLESVRLPAGLTELSEGMFHGCKNLHIEIPEGITKICREALSGCPMDRIQIPASVDWVRAYSFGTTEGSFFWYVINQGMPNLEAFSVAAGNQAYCAIDGVLFTADKKTLVCYPHAKKDESYTVPTGVKEIWFGAFSCCKYLKHLDLTSVSEIDTCAFSYCLALESIDFSEKNKKMSSAIIGCSALKEITLPKQMKELPERMFDGCRSLQRVVLPPELKKIGRRAFADCRELTEIELPQSVKSIGFCAFKGCRNLHSLIVNSPDTKAEFCDLGCATVYAPKDSKMSAYAKEHGHKLVEKE